ncbi:hypothetical protein DRE_01116 [Drechslerella stenobrocha 248]|uniref:Clr5 domain-containing protein n=1 Tax=Drechslerella stenobrocha 248 TaxID=1043628 RepID=W7I6A0_9PEZI|nr:hypothetical protein DRE_01116 [Drechslerella stenobrocha 248]
MNINFHIDGSEAVQEAARPYVRAQDHEMHRDFVTGMFKSGATQKNIVNALKAERGVTITLSRLKNLCVGWNLSNKNLTKARKLHIRESIRKRQDVHGKTEHLVRLQASGRELNPKELHSIMDLSPSCFEGIAPSPAGGDILIMTPAALNDDQEENAGGLDATVAGARDAADEEPTELPDSSDAEVSDSNATNGDRHEVAENYDVEMDTIGSAQAAHDTGVSRMAMLLSYINTKTQVKHHAILAMAIYRDYIRSGTHLEG